MNAECKLVKKEELGDHVMFIGEVKEISADENIKPLVYHDGEPYGSHLLTLNFLET